MMYELEEEKDGADLKGAWGWGREEGGPDPTEQPSHSKFNWQLQRDKVGRGGLH